MQLTEQTERFDHGYRTGEPPWVIGEPQPAVVELERADGFRGRVLDIGCGSGEHTLLLARRGYEAIGADASPAALERARQAGRDRGITACFRQVDALYPAGLGLFDTILDSALFHVFGPADRDRYTTALLGLCEPGAVLHLLALAETDAEPAGPVIPRSAIVDAFDRHGWEIEDIATSTYRGVVTEGFDPRFGVEAGTKVDVPAWLARIRRT